MISQEQIDLVAQDSANKYYSRLSRKYFNISGHNIKHLMFKCLQKGIELGIKLKENDTA